MTDLKSIELFIAPGCPHCPNMIKMTSEMVKKGDIGKLQIINIAIAPDLAQLANIRSVPAFRIGDITLTGVHTAAELMQWVNKAFSESGMVDFYNQEFDQGRLNEVIESVIQKPQLLELMLTMLSNMETPLTSRIGISALFEHFQNSQALKQLIPKICKLTEDKHESIRTDMAHLLGLTGDSTALPCLNKLTKDKFEDVRETAIESIETIEEHLQADN